MCTHWASHLGEVPPAIGAAGGRQREARLCPPLPVGGAPARGAGCGSSPLTQSLVTEFHMKTVKQDPVQLAGKRISNYQAVKSQQSLRNFNNYQDII